MPFLGGTPLRAFVEGSGSIRGACTVTLNEWLDEVGLVDAETNMPRPQVDLVCKLETTAARARERLGLDPHSYVQLERALAETSRSKRDVVDRLDDDKPPPPVSGGVMAVWRRKRKALSPAGAHNPARSLPSLCCARSGLTLATTATRSHGGVSQLDDQRADALAVLTVFADALALARQAERW